MSADLGSGWVFHLDPRVNFDTQHTAGARLFFEESRSRPALTLNEVFLDWYGPGLELSVGKKIYDWKVADGFSPVDGVNPVDFIEMLNPEKIGVPSISLLKMFENFDWQVVFVPVFIPSRLPGDTSRWSSDDPEGRDRFIQMFGMSPVHVDLGRDLGSHDLGRASVATRLTSSTLVPGWDLALIYQYGYAPQGVIRNDIIPWQLPQVFQTTEYPAFHLFGASFSTAVDEVEYHGEAGFHNTLDNEKDEDYLSFVLGVNHTRYDWLSQWVEEVRLVAEYAGEVVVKKRPETSAYSDLGVGRGLTNNIIARMTFKIDSDRCVNTAVIYNLSHGDSLVEGTYETQLDDHLKLIFGAQVLTGDDTSFFGQWDHNDRIYLNVVLTY
jgi:hypothetical protein